MCRYKVSLDLSSSFSLLLSQVESKSVFQRRTMYPNGTAVTMDVELRPIKIKFSESAEPNTMVLAIANPVSVQVIHVL